MTYAQLGFGVNYNLSFVNDEIQYFENALQIVRESNDKSIEGKYVLTCYREVSEIYHELITGYQRMTQTYYIL